ncbi:MAG: hypothetical protein WC443_10100 [Desulfobaccales bacterium]
METPNVENLFMAGGVAFFFNTGTGERDLGLFEAPPEVDVKATEVPFYSSRSGKQRLAKIFTTKEEVAWSMKLKELVAANIQAFFKGGPLEIVNAGTAAVVDQLVQLHGELLTSVGKYGLTLVSAKKLDDTPLVKNTDYIVDPGSADANGLLVGRIGRLADSELINDGDTIKVSYTHVTWSSLRFPVAADDYQQGAARIQFRPLNGFLWNYIIPKCQLKPDGKLTFDPEKTMELPMILQVLDAYDTNPTAPYGYWECLNES